MNIKFILAITWLCLLLPGRAQNTVFTYQGRLNSSGAPANGFYDLRFRIYDAATAGNILGTITTPIVSVSNGLFITQLDFGSNVFNGDPRWLSIDVRSTGDPGSYTTLSPRQQLTAAPYAIQAGTAATFNGQIVDGQLSANIPRLNANAVFTGLTTFSNASGNFSGNGAGISNVNASSLNGLDASSFWKTGGNSNTTAGTHFVGTADAQPLEFKVNKSRVLRIESTVSGAPNSIGGSEVNVIDPGVVGSVILGGGATNFGGSRLTNSIAASFSVIGSGLQNRINTNAGFSMIASGRGNTIDVISTNCIIGAGIGNLIQSNVQFAVLGNGWSNDIAPYSTYAIIGSGLRNKIGIGGVASVIGNGWMNTIEDHTGAAFIGSGQGNLIRTYGDYGVILGGFKNTIGLDSVAAAVQGGALNTIGEEAAYSVIGGGLQNVVADYAMAATVPGGFSNVAGGFCSFAAGRNARANHDGTFVWSDNQTINFVSTGTNQFLIRAQGGVGIGTNHPASALHVNGVVTATSFEGDGSSLQNLENAPALQRLSRRLNEQFYRMEEKEREIQVLRQANAALEKRLVELENRFKNPR